MTRQFPCCRWCCVNATRISWANVICSSTRRRGATAAMIAANGWFASPDLDTLVLFPATAAKRSVVNAATLFTSRRLANMQRCTSRFSPITVRKTCYLKLGIIGVRGCLYPGLGRGYLPYPWGGGSYRTLGGGYLPYRLAGGDGGAKFQKMCKKVCTIESLLIVFFRGRQTTSLQWKHTREEGASKTLSKLLHPDGEKLWLQSHELPMWKWVLLGMHERVERKPLRLLRCEQRIRGE